VIGKSIKNIKYVTKVSLSQPHSKNNEFDELTNKDTSNYIEVLVILLEQQIFCSGF